MQYNFDYLVIGSGIAGLNFVLEAAKSGTVAIVTKKELMESNSNYAQGGIAAVLDKHDSFAKHINLINSLSVSDKIKQDIVFRNSSKLFPIKK